MHTLIFKRIFFSALSLGKIALCLLFLLPHYIFASGMEIEGLQKARKEVENSIVTMNRQYKEVVEKINLLKSKQNLSILEEAELLRLMALAQSLSVQLEKRYLELEKIVDELKAKGVEIPREKLEVLTFRISEGSQFEGPAELQEKVLILKDKESKLLREIERLETFEKKMRLKEEYQAFMMEQSLFDEDSMMAVVKKNVKGVSESSAQIEGESKGDKSVSDTNYESGLGTSSTLPSSSGQSSQDIKIRIEVTYEKSGIVNQPNLGKDRSLFIDIDLSSVSADELREKIELLKKIYEELTLKRKEIEKRAVEIERLFKEKK